MPLRIVTLCCFLQSSLENAIKDAFHDYNDIDDDDDAEFDDNHIRIILEAGVVPTSRAFYIAIREENVSLCQLLVHHGGNPFLMVPSDTRDEDDDDEEELPPAASPFLAAARLANILPFAHFLDLWYNEQHFSASHGKNANGDYPLHAICHDPHVSLQVIVHMIAHDGNALTTSSGGQDGFFPFQIAAVANADLDIIFYLLNRCPDALRRFRLLDVAEPVSTGNTSSGTDKKSEGSDAMGIIALENGNALRDENESLRVEKETAQAERDAAVEAMKLLQAEIEKLQQDLAATTTTTLHAAHDAADHDEATA